MEKDTETVVRFILGLSADLNAIKEVLCRAKLTTPDELQELQAHALQQILSRADVADLLAKARWSDALSSLGKL
jgi:hypothetical protein